MWTLVLLPTQNGVGSENGRWDLDIRSGRSDPSGLPHLSAAELASVGQKSAICGLISSLVPRTYPAKFQFVIPCFVAGQSRGSVWDQKALVRTKKTVGSLQANFTLLPATAGLFLGS